jgi:hypothetical protein
MTQIVSELYEALKAAGVEDDLARRAASSVLGRMDPPSLINLARHAASAALAREQDALKVATKSDLLDLQIRLQRFLILQTIAMIGIFAALVAIMELL